MRLELASTSVARLADAAVLARQYNMSRQRIGYHMRDLEKAGHIEIVGERKQRGLTEKLYQVTPRVFAQAPAGLEVGAIQSHFSFSRLVNILGTALFSLARLKPRADAQKKRIATLAMDAELYLATPAQRKAFATELLDASPEDLWQAFTEAEHIKNWFAASARSEAGVERKSTLIAAC